MDEDFQVDATTIIDPTEMAEHNAVEQEDRNVDDEGDDTSRVENSFVEPPASQEPTVEPPPSVSQSVTRSGRKRKRTTGNAENTTSKKQKQSPFRRVISGIFGRPQHDDEDIGEDIVVASQPTESPRILEAVKTEETPREPSVSSTAVQQTKRGRGRPRKSETPTPAPPTAIPLACSTRSKRRASEMSQTNEESSEPAVTEAKSTPAPKRQRRRAKAKKAIEEARKSQEESSSRPSSSRREATGVLIEPADSDVDISQTRMATDDEDASGEDSQGKSQEAIATPLREAPPRETPKSILGRLRDILGDCKNAIFGSQEEREFDDVLFELRREVHGAANRGR